MLFELKIEGNHKADLTEKELLFFWFLHCWISLMLVSMCTELFLFWSFYCVLSLFSNQLSPQDIPTDLVQNPKGEEKCLPQLTPCIPHVSATLSLGLIQVFCFFNPLTSMSDQDRISPYNINTISTRYVIRIEKNINLEIIGWSNTKFSELTL